MTEETKNLLQEIDEVIEETTELTTESEVAKAPAPEIEIKEETVIPTKEEAQEYVDTLNKDKEVEDGKSLIESIYEKEEEKLKDEAKKQLDDLVKEDELPEIELKELEKEKEAEKIAEEVADIVENKKKSPTEVIEELTDMFIEKEEKLSRELKLEKKKNQVLEDIVEKLTEEVNRLKYWEWKVWIVDDFMGAFATTYKELKENPTDTNLLKKMWVLYLSWARTIYPELSIDAVNKLIVDAREANLRAIQWINEGWMKDWNIKDTVKIEKPTRPSGFVIG